MTKTKKDSGADKAKDSYLALDCDKVGEVAVHYGFTVIKTPHITSDDISKSKQFKDFDYHDEAEEKVALTRWYMEERQDAGAQPVAIHYRKPFPGSTSKKSGSKDVYGFEIMGSSKSTSEALLIKCALGILDDLGYEDLYVDINSIGDRESIAKFERELHSYFRKHIGDISSKKRQEFKKNPHLILLDTDAETQSFRENAPQPIATLSDISKLHFKEVLESIESFGIPYKIKPQALSNKHYGTHTVFEIRQTTPVANKTGTGTDGTLLAYGYRYNHIAKKIGGKKEIPTVGMKIIVKRDPKVAKKVIIKNIKKPTFYLVQLGLTAKLKALNVVEMLRKHKIPVYHSITKDKITGQLSGAEYMKATHVLIMGQKEAIDNTIVVRSMNNREQETVPVSGLAEFLKKL